jgi:excisionase family DNA binding protein
MWVLAPMDLISSQLPAPCSITTFERLLSSGQAAALLGIHPKTLVRLARSGEVPAIRIGKHWRFRASLLDAYVADQLLLTRQPA